jgi:hypothetical protein
LREIRQRVRYQEQDERYRRWTRKAEAAPNACRYDTTMAADRGPRRWARIVAAPAERRLAAVVGRLITDKLAYHGLDHIAAMSASSASFSSPTTRSLRTGFLEFELADAEFGQAVDWGLCRRMLRAGVRVGMVPEPTTDYFPSWEWAGRKERHARRQAMSDGAL